MKAALPAVLLLLSGGAPPGAGAVLVEIAGLRSAKGLVRACLTRRPASFPDCRRDPQARRVSVPAAGATAIPFEGVAPGRYAVSLLHDENGNGRADMALLLPREGFGFSRNPRLRLGPPRFARASFAVEDRPVTQAIRMRYLL